MTAFNVDASALPSSMFAGSCSYWEWLRNVHALVAAAFVSGTDLGCLFQRREIEYQPNLLALHFERACST